MFTTDKKVVDKLGILLIRVIKPKPPTHPGDAQTLPTSSHHRVF